MRTNRQTMILAGLCVLALGATPATQPGGSGGASNGPTSRNTNPGMNSTYQPTYAEYLARSFDNTEPVSTVMGGPTWPLVDIITRPAAVAGEIHIEVGGSVTFDASGSEARRNDSYGGNEITDFIWTFQDGGDANAPIVRHVFDRQGIYTVRLVVHDETGWQEDAAVQVSVGDNPCGLEPMEVWIPTVDGLTMHGWVTVPAGEGPFPTVLEYGPYVPTQEDPCTGTVRNRTARARVSAPGRGRSTGEWDMFGPQTRQGGYDAVEWFAGQSWSDGKVGLYGLSGPAVAALLTAGAHPPHLSCVAAMTSYADLYRDMVMAGGVRNSDTFVNTWLQTLTVQDAQTVYASGEVPGAPGIGPNGEVLDHGVTNTERAVDLATRPYDDAWWRERSIVDAPPPDVPVIYYGNARDLWPRATVELERWIAPGGGRVVQLHGGHGNGEVTGWLRARENTLWFDWCLKGIDNGVQDRPHVLTLTTYGGDAAVPFSFGRWEALDGFATEMVEPVRMYLRNANANAEAPLHHTLSEEPPNDGELPTVLNYSPVQGATAGTTAGTAHQAGGLQQSWESHSLVYETPLLTQELPVNGPVTLQLYARPISADIAFTAHVNDVWPDGTSHYLAKGALLGSHRALDAERSRYLTDDDDVRVLIQPYHPHTQEKVQTLVPGQVYRFDIEIWSVHNAFQPGHRLRLALAAQDLGWRTHPEPGPAALVLNDAAHASTLNLPVLPQERSHSPFPLDHGDRTTTR